MEQFNLSENKKMPLKAIVVFSILVLLLVIVLITMLLVGKNRKKEIENKKEKPASNPIIEVKQNGEEKLDIKVTHSEYLESVSYSWNDDVDTEKSYKTGRTKDYTIPNVEIIGGTNTLTVVAKGVLGGEAIYKNNFTNNKGKDIGKPQINLSLEKKGKNIKVTVKDNDALSKVSYRWNDEEEHEIELQEERQSEVSFNIKIIAGKNILHVVAEDNTGNVTTVRKQYDGIEAPVLSFNATSDGKAVILTATHPKGIKSIEYKLNGESFSSGEIKDTFSTVARTKILLTEENNEIEAKATSNDGVTCHPEIRTIKLQKREEVDDFGDRVTKENNENNN